MPANLENSAVATGLEKVSFHSNPKERQCQRIGREGRLPCFVCKGFPTFRSHLRMRPVSRRHSRSGLVGGSTFRRTPISRSPLHAGGRFLEADLQVVAKVHAALGAPTVPTCASGEKALENVVEDATESRLEAPEPLEATAGPGRTEPVVGLPLVGVAQHFVGFADLLEALLGGWISRILVGVVLVGQLAVGLLNLLGPGVAVDPQNLVVVALLTHD